MLPVPAIAGALLGAAGRGVVVQVSLRNAGDTQRLSGEGELVPDGDLFKISIWNEFGLTGQALGVTGISEAYLNNYTSGGAKLLAN